MRLLANCRSRFRDRPSQKSAPICRTGAPDGGGDGRSDQPRPVSSALMDAAQKADVPVEVVGERHVFDHSVIAGFRGAVEKSRPISFRRMQ
jgi:hypothetical protein